VANLTRRDGEEFFALIAKSPVETTTQCFPLEEANEALDCLRSGNLTGAAVLQMDFAGASGILAKARIGQQSATGGESKSRR
jgi:hypothetical protein